MSKQKGRKAEIVLSDGRDNGSKVSIEQAIESAQRADTLVYSILFADEEQYPMTSPGYGGYGRRRGMGGPMPRYPQSNLPDGKKVLERIAKETGGGFYQVSKKETIDKIYAHIQEELRNQYSLGYTSDQPNGSGYRKILVTAKQKGLIVQARDGYYAGGR
jgi:VWFA-related protein